MLAVRVEILRWVDDWQPGWVECRLTDSYCREHTFIEKVPVVSKKAIYPESAYPQPGLIACEVIRGNAEVVTIDTDPPLGSKSTDQETQFDVPPHLIIEL